MRAPRNDSSSVICLLTALCVRQSSSAAPVTLPVRAVVSNAIRFASAGRWRPFVLFMAVGRDGKPTSV
ncbi:hypothetical protein D3C80_2184800 [compost metagenome]